MARGEQTRARIVEAALDTLRERGFAGATNRAIAETGGFNPALTFYYFGSVNELLLAALGKASSERLQRYAPEARAARGPSELLALMRRIYAEDVDSGFVRVASEMVAGSVAHPELGPRVVEQMEPWIALAEETFPRILSDTPFEAIADPRDLANAAVMLYLGGNLLTQLVPERRALDSLLDAAGRVLG